MAQQVKALPCKSAAVNAIPRTQGKPGYSNSHMYPYNPKILETEAGESPKSLQIGQPGVHNTVTKTRGLVSQNKERGEKDLEVLTSTCGMWHLCCPTQHI